MPAPRSSVPRRSVLALAILSMLTEAPMHAYRMQQLIKERHKEDVVNVVQRNSIYQTLDRLLRDELVEVAATERSDNRPERTTYRITASGRAALRTWLIAMVSTPAAEFPEFPAALSFLPSLSPAEALAAVTDRVGHLQQKLATIERELAQGGTFLPRLFLIESEYQRDVIAAELAYVQTLQSDLTTGELIWPIRP
jgi:DNA-binding PadR family transcriptional regulator